MLRRDRLHYVVSGRRSKTLLMRRIPSSSAFGSETSTRVSEVRMRVCSKTVKQLVRVDGSNRSLSGIGQGSAIDNV